MSTENVQKIINGCAFPALPASPPYPVQERTYKMESPTIWPWPKSPVFPEPVLTMGDEL